MRIKDKPLDMKTIIIIFLIYRSTSTARQGIFNVDYWDKYIYSIICCAFIFVILVKKNNFVLKLPMKLTQIAKLIMVPMIVAFFVTIISSFIKEYNIAGFLSRSFSNVAYTFLALVQAYLMYQAYDKHGVDLVFCAYSLSYFTSIIVAFLNGGLSQFILMMFDSTYNGSVLEMSELAPAFCLFVFYYLYQLRYCNSSKKKCIPKIVISLLFLIIGMKRILILALILTMIIYYLFKKRVSSIQKWSLFLSTMLIALAYVFVYYVDKGILFKALDYFNINSMSRKELWKAISSEYTFSLKYFGNGLGYTTKWLDLNWMKTGIIGLTQTTGLHSDILKFYIDFGFIGFGLYLYYFLRYMTKTIARRIDNKAAFVYFLMTVLQFFCWFTDNISFFHIFMWPFYMMTFSLITDSRYINDEQIHK